MIYSSSTLTGNYVLFSDNVMLTISYKWANICPANLLGFGETHPYLHSLKNLKSMSGKQQKNYTTPKSLAYSLEFHKRTDYKKWTKHWRKQRFLLPQENYMKKHTLIYQTSVWLKLVNCTYLQKQLFEQTPSIYMLLLLLYIYII